MMRTNLHVVTVFILVVCGAASVQAVDRYVARNGQTPVSPFTAGWTAAASNIQDAINVAFTNDTLWVGAGVYTVPPNGVAYSSVTNVVYINRPLALRGYSGNPADVTIDGEGMYRGIHLAYNTTTNVYFTLSGLTVARGYTNGILFTATSGRSWTGIVASCVVTGCTLGGAIDAVGANNITVIISNTTARNNEGIGLGFYGSAATLDMTDCTIEQKAGAGGSFHLGTHSLTRCVVRGNGGGFSIGSGLNQFYNCLLCNNVQGSGGAVYGWNAGSDVRFYNSTLVSNRATSIGGGIRTSGASASFKMFNTILYSNYVGAAHSNYDLGGNTNSFFTNVCTYPSLAGTGNITNRPAFADFAGQNFRLSRGSPCINAGLNNAWPMTGAVDLDGNRRVDLGHDLVDLGCYEYVFPGGTLIQIR